MFSPSRHDIKLFFANEGLHCADFDKNDLQESFKYEFGDSPVAFAGIDLTPNSTYLNVAFKSYE